MRLRRALPAVVATALVAAVLIVVVIQVGGRLDGGGMLDTVRSEGYEASPPSPAVIPCIAGVFSRGNCPISRAEAERIAARHLGGRAVASGLLEVSGGPLDYPPVLVWAVEVAPRSIPAGECVPPMDWPVVITGCHSSSADLVALIDARTGQPPPCRSVNGPPGTRILLAAPPLVACLGKPSAPP